jgi:hypothetical protein
MNAARIEALWYEQGTIHDARMMLYLQSGRRKWIPIRRIRETWALAQKEGRLPPSIVRPHHGFPPGPSSILKRFMMIEREKRAA